MQNQCQIAKTVLRGNFIALNTSTSLKNTVNKWTKHTGQVRKNNKLRKTGRITG